MSGCGFFLNRVRTVFLQKQANLNLSCVCSQLRVYSNKPVQPVIVEGVSDIIQPKKPKRPIVPRITLLSGNDDITVTTLEEAQKLSKRRDLKLVKIVDLDTKTQRPVYKLMTPTEYHAEDVKSKKEKQKNTAFKGEKVVMLTSAIQEHDLQTHIKKISKWLSKEYEVRVIISSTGGNTSRFVSIYICSNLYSNIQFSKICMS